MEAFTLLKYWRGSSIDTAVGESSSFTSNNNSTTTTTIVTAVNSDDESGDDDDGPFFDLEFAVPCEESREIDCSEGNAQTKIEEDCDSDESETEGENGRDFEFALSSGSSGGGGDQTDPSDDLFFKGRLVSIDTSPTNGSEQNPKSLFLQKSANRLRILMLKLKKSKCGEGQKTDTNGSAHQERLIKPPANKFFTVKFKVEEVPIISLFTRDGSKSQKQQQQQQQQQKQIDREIPPVLDSALSSTSDDKRYSKELMQKYLNKVKPMYVHVSRRYAEKLKFSGQLSFGSVKTPSNEDKDSSPAVKPEKESSETANAKGQKQGNLQAGLKIAYKHLGKSRSASSAVAASPLVAIPSRRCDDSLLDQQDGIQGAILHCKRSFNSSRDCSSLARSVSDPTPPRKVP